MLNKIVIVKFVLGLCLGRSGGRVRVRVKLVMMNYRIYCKYLSCQSIESSRINSGSSCTDVVGFSSQPLSSSLEILKLSVDSFGGS